MIFSLCFRQNWLTLLQPMTFAVWMAFLASVLVVIAILVTSVRAFGIHWTGISAGNGVLFILGSIFGEPYPFHPRYSTSVQINEKLLKY